MKTPQRLAGSVQEAIASTVRRRAHIAPQRLLRGATSLAPFISPAAAYTRATLAILRTHLLRVVFLCWDFMLRWATRHKASAAGSYMLERATQTLPTLSEDVPENPAYYQQWLAHERERRSSPYFVSARSTYSTTAAAPTTFAQRTIYPFAPFNRRLSAITTITRGQTIVLLLLIALWVTELYFNGVATLIAMITIPTAIYIVNLVMTCVISARVISAAPEETITDFLLSGLGNDVWPMYTILCPLYREVAVVPQFVRAISALDYPRDCLQVLLLTEEDDVETRQAILDMHLPPHFQVITVPDGQPRTKPRACNYGLMLAEGSFTVIYDAEDVPDPLQLKKAVLAFANHDARLACVQAKLSFYNPGQNLLTRWFAMEYALWFNIMLPGMQWAGVSLPLGGTSNHFRTDVLRRLGGWDPFNVTEDCDLGLRLAHYHLRTAILDSTTMEEANSDLRNWIRQRSRWIKGYMQTYLVHLRQPWLYFTRRRFREFFSLQLVIGGTPATFVINPLMWTLLAIYIALRAHVIGQYQILYAPFVFYPAVICLVFGNFVYLYIHLLACYKSKQLPLILWVFTLPLYWSLMSVAAVMATYQLIVKPHYWEKTLHGLHLTQETAPSAAVPTPEADVAPATVAAAVLHTVVPDEHLVASEAL